MLNKLKELSKVLDKFIDWLALDMTVAQFNRRALKCYKRGDKDGAIANFALKQAAVEQKSGIFK